MNFENLSASYDVGIAKQFGINCAVLLNKLMYLSKYTSREDGFCWRTAKELEDELGLTQAQQQLAIKKLEEVGILETKNTYIVGTQIKCKHFKILKSDIDKNNNYDLDDYNKSDLHETYKSINNNNTIIIDNNNSCSSYNNKEVFELFEQNLGRLLSPLEIEKIQEWSKDFNIELIEEALRISLLNNKKNLNYIGAILRNWKSQGYKMKQDIEENTIKEDNNFEVTPEMIAISDYDWLNDDSF